MNREEALNLVKKYTSNKNLIKHMLAVEVAMKAYAKRFGEDEETWGLCGILHDVDYERMGVEHPSAWGQNLLKENCVEEKIIQAILGHGDGKESLRTTNMAKALFAVDRLSGFIVACALVRPNKLSDVDVESVKKSMKKKEFAKAIDREEINQGAKELGVELDEHISVVLDAMKSIKGELGL